MFSALMAWIGGCAADVATLAVGPFTLEARGKRISSGRFPNISANPFEKITVSSYRVLHGRMPVSTASALALPGDRATNPDDATQAFWDVRVLGGAPRPALLAGTTGLWLISEEDGKPVLRTLAPAETSIATWQWLDEEHGQPGPEHAVTIRDSGSEPRTIAEGTLLMLSRRGVLDVSTLQFHPYLVNTHERVQALDGFNAYGSPIKRVSPDRRRLVYVGNRSVDSYTEYALVVADFRTGDTYALPFDSNATRFESIWDATPAWTERWFEWRRDDAGAFRLVARTNAASPPWLGRMIEFDGDNPEFKLYPVVPDMMAALVAFIESDVGARLTGPAETDSVAFELDGKPFKVWRDPERHSVSVFPERIKGFVVEGTPALIRQIGARFNESLAGGSHQQHFTRYPDHR